MHLNIHENKHVYTKTFVIATLFWEKWCIFWKSFRDANTFIHDCIYHVWKSIPAKKETHLAIFSLLVYTSLITTSQSTGEFYWSV